MPLSVPLQRFAADELARLPALIERVRREAADALRTAADPAQSAAERVLRFDAAQALDIHAGRFCDTFVAVVARRARSDTAAFDTADLRSAAAPRRALAVLDAATHSADIEIAHAASLIASAAEWELRELQAFASALAGLPYVSADANPLPAEAFAQALWQATGSLPEAAAPRRLVLRAAAGPLADALRRLFAAACTRLEAEGVQPSLYRSAVPTAGDRSSMLAELLESGRIDLTGPSATPAATADAATTALLESLFEAIGEDNRMHPALRALPGPLHAVALSLAPRDTGLLDEAGHPLWQLLDRLAHQSATHPHPDDPQLLAWASLAAEVVARLEATPLLEAHHLRAGIGQLDRYAEAQFNAQLRQAAADIDALARNDAAAAALSIAALDTVPGELLSATPAAGSDTEARAAAWLAGQVPGGWYRMFLRGRWTVLRLLWRGDAPSRWLLAGTYPQRNDAFDRASLLRLRAEALLRPFVERAVVARAAEAVRRKLTERRRAG